MVGHEGVTDVLQPLSRYIQQEPLLSAVAITLAVFTVIFVVLLIRWLRRPPGVRFRKALSKPEKITILMHPNPDPDAMACAQAVAYLAEEVGTAASIRHPGQIRHQENRAFRTVLDLDCERIETADDLPDGSLVLVDHNEPRGFPGAAGLAPYAVIDHHPGQGSGTAHNDVRPEYGACASIVAEYLKSLKLDPIDPDRHGALEGLPARVATGLLYGILADTDHLTRGASPAEFTASAYLYPGIDEDSLERIANPAVDAEILDIKAEAITKRDVRAPFAVSDVGQISNVDAIPQAADELMTLEGVSAVVVIGQIGDTLHLSGRSRDDRVHMGEVLETAVADIPMSSAGGHARMGGGQVSAPHMGGLRTDSGRNREELKERIFECLSGDL